VIEMKKRNPIAIAAAALIVAAGLALMAYPFVTDLRYAVAQKQMAAAAPVAPTNAGGQAMPEGAVARLVIPAISLDAFVGEGTTPEVLNEGPGHYEETPLPGEQGNSAIAGHRTMYGHPFRHLDSLQPGDVITTYTAARRAHYRVVSVAPVDPSDVGVAAPTDDSRLTLTTCNPVGSARERLVVVATLVE
jgi:LPXTG-site transpeptidase (sortase) family protein